MSFKKISVILLAFIMIIPTFGVYAAEKSLYTTVDHDAMTVDIEYTNSDCAYILCGIAIENADSGELIYYIQQKTNRSGRINLDSVKIGTQGSFTVTVSPVTGQAASVQDFYIFGDDDIDALWALITTSTDASDIKSDWGEIKAAFGINEKYITNIDTLTALIAADSDIKSLDEKNDENIALLNEYIGKNELFAAADYLNKDSELNDIKPVIKDSYIMISEADNTFYNELKALESEDAAIFENMLMNFASSDKDIVAINDIIEVLKSAIKDAKADKILNEIKSVNHISEIYTILTEDGNADILGIKKDMDDYKKLENSDVADKYIAESEFDDAKEFADVFSKAVAKAKRAEDGDSGASSPNNSSRPGSGAGSIGNAGSNSGSYTPPVTDAPDTQDGFADMAGYEWAQEAVNKLCDMGIVNGYGDNSYRPYNALTRAEFVKIIMSFAKWLDVSGEDISFSDITPSDWFYTYAVDAAKAGLVKGDGMNFNPNANITRQDAAVIILRLVNANSITIDGGKEFADSQSVADYAIDAVSSLAYAGIINGFEDGTFAPEKNITRAEAAVMISRLIAKYPIAEVE